MHFSMAFIWTLMSTAALIEATPALTNRQTAQPVPTSTVPVPAKYQLQTKVVPGIKDCGSNKNKLFVVSYHTGAGLGIAGLAKNASQFYGYLNGSQQLFTYEGSNGPWPMVAEQYPYRLFNEISISVSGSQASSGFYFNETGLQLQGNAGWIACNWWYSYPELFALNGYDTERLPRCCSKVHLMPIAI